MFSARGRPGRTRLRPFAMVAVAATAFALLPGIAFAFHGGNNIIVGQDFTGANQQRFHPGLKTMYVGQAATFSFAAGAHNVGIDTASLPAGASAFRSPQFAGGTGEPVGSTFTYTFTLSGTYNYYCSVHASQADANSATFDANGEPSNGKMVGRIVVNVDTTGPAWDAGTPTATGVSASQINLTWPAASDPETGISEYRVFEATGATRPAKPGSPCTGCTVTGTSLSRTGLTSGQHYWYWVTAVNGASAASSTDQLMDATTSSVAASATATGVVQFAVNPTLSITVSPGVLDLGTVSPAAPANGTQIVNVKSNDVWSLSVKSVGANGVDDNPGDDAVFTSSGGLTIPIGRMTWQVSGPATALSDANVQVLSGQAVTPSAGTDTSVALVLQVQYSDPPGSGFRTVILYTATQP